MQLTYKRVLLLQTAVAALYCIIYSNDGNTQKIVEEIKQTEEFQKAEVRALLEEMLSALNEIKTDLKEKKEG